jgi:alpha-glucosidase
VNSDLRSFPVIRSSDERLSTAAGWWRDAVIYQVYLRSFADSDGDGLGDIAGLCSRLDYLVSLGVDAIWVNPWYQSPLNDGGYDVSDYRRIHPLFGNMRDARNLIEQARQRDLRILIDLVPNHTSSEHAWFEAALRAPRGSVERSRYHFRPGRGRAGELPPNDWQSVFGGSAWTQVPDGDWYLHMYDVTQPDLNWSNGDVRAEFLRVLRYWLDLGVSGFRVDVAHGKTKHPDYPDVGDIFDHLDPAWHDEIHPTWDRPELHGIVREWREVVDEYPGSILVAEAWVANWDRLARYVRPGEYHQAFDFLFLEAPWDATTLKKRIDDAVNATAAVGAAPTWTLSNHDVVRHPTRYGLPQQVDTRAWLLGGDRALLDEELGLRRARAAVLLLMALPGSIYLYQGEELGLPEVHDLPIEALDDPIWKRSGYTRKGRDGCRVPIPWTRDGPSFGFGSGQPWLPQPAVWAELSVSAQEDDETSTLNLYRSAIRLRGELLGDEVPFEWIEEGEDVVAFRRGDLVCTVNFGPDRIAVPPGTVILASEPIVEGLPANTAVWVGQAPDGAAARELPAEPS